MIECLRLNVKQVSDSSGCGIIKVTEQEDREESGKVKWEGTTNRGLLISVVCSTSAAHKCSWKYFKLFFLNNVKYILINISVNDHDPVICIKWPFNINYVNK